MDPLLQFLLTLFSCLFALLVFICFQYLRSQIIREKKKKICTAPQAGGAWPIIGHMHLLSGRQLTHKTLGAMADKYGPVFTIRLSSHRVLVLNSWEMARECFTVHNKVFSTRPSIAASKLLGYDYAMFGFAPYGSYWREMRKIATIELLSNHRLDVLKHIRASESIPPAFIKHFTGNIPKKAILIDHTGNSWPVELDQIGSRLCFKCGWQQFASDHSLEFGDFLIFNYNRSNVFKVKIFNKTGCMKYEAEATGKTLPGLTPEEDSTAEQACGRLTRGGKRKLLQIGLKTNEEAGVSSKANRHKSRRIAEANLEQNKIRCGEYRFI